MRNNEPHLLFTLRTAHLPTHAGQVSFAGGHIEPGETAEEAAKREASEELGVSLPLETLGQLHEAIAITGTHVTPVVTAALEPLEDLSSLKPSPGEVAEVFTLSLAHLADPRNHEYEFLSKKAKGVPPASKSSSSAAAVSSSGSAGPAGKTVISVKAHSDPAAGEPLGHSHEGPPHPRAGLWLPYFVGGPARVWGLTGFLTMELLRDVLIPAARSIGYPLPEPRSPPNGGPPDIPNLPPSMTERATEAMVRGQRQAR